MEWFWSRSGHNAWQQQASRYAKCLMEASLDPLFSLGTDGKIREVNEAVVRITGVPRELLIGTDFSDYFTEPERARQGNRQVLDNGSIRDYPLIIRGRDGRLTEVLYSSSLCRDCDGTLLGILATARDKTERMKADDKFRAL